MTEYSPQWREKPQPGVHAVRDMDYFQGMYPWRIKVLQRYVIHQCDIMDYSGSPIYDEYPDVWMIEQACQAVCGMIPQSWMTGEESDENLAEHEKAQDYTAQAVEIMQNRPGGPPPGGPPPGGRPPGGPPPWGPPPWGPPPGGRPPGGPPPWGPPPGGPPPWGPPPGKPPHNDWLSDIVKVLFMNEIQRRRCRMGRC